MGYLIGQGLVQPIQLLNVPQLLLSTKHKQVEETTSYLEKIIQAHLTRSKESAENETGNFTILVLIIAGVTKEILLEQCKKLSEEAITADQLNIAEQVDIAQRISHLVDIETSDPAG